jgi:hypothetical protein
MNRYRFFMNAAIATLLVLVLSVSSTGKAFAANNDEDSINEK